MSIAAASRTPARVAVMGAGSWGTAFALVVCDAGNQVTLWARRPELADKINFEHCNTDYFPDLRLPESLRAVSDPEEAMREADCVVLAVPSQSLRDNLRQWQIPETAIVVSLAKGIELGTGLRMSEVVAEAGDIAPDRIVAVTGPNLAREIAERQPSASVVASVSPATAEAFQAVCHTARFRAYTNTDVIGCELAGATKNVIALAVGMAIGLGLGANATASVITRGLAEITRLGVALGADPYTFSGLAGLGDLVATCSSPLSRNRHFGEELGRGRTVAEITASTRQVAEGVKSCASITELAAKHHVELPIVGNVAAVIAGELTPAEMITALMSRSAKPERYCPCRAELSSAWARSAQRSSTCSIPTDSLTKPSGTVGSSPGQRRRRSRVDSTPPRLVAKTHSEHASMNASAVLASASSMEISEPKPDMVRRATS